MPLVYVFWHWSEVPLARRAEQLRAFHRALAETGLALAAGSFLSPGIPWASAPEPIGDWYALEGWETLGELNREAVRGGRSAPHQAAAATVAGSTAGLYAVSGGDLAGFGSPTETWFEAPAGVGASAFEAEVRARLPWPGAAPASPARAGAVA